MVEKQVTDFGMNEMLDMQRKLQEQYKDWWEPINPELSLIHI